MLEGIPPEFLMLVIGAFVLGWLVAKTGSAISDRKKAKVRDPRDDRIRSLEAENRISHNELEKIREASLVTKKELDAAKKGLDERAAAIEAQTNVVNQLRADLKESVKKTRELRAELSDRATESVRSEVKLREVETELEVSRASTDLIATGVLDYSITPDEDEESELKSVIKAAT